MSIDMTPPSYWYSESTDDERGSRVMEALRSYRAAEMAMRRRTQESMAMGENEMVVLRYLTRSEAAHRSVTPVDLARYVGMSTASMTSLLDRLERTGHLERRPHPSDRRKVLVHTTSHADEEMRSTLGAMHDRMMSATRGMSESETVTVTAFLERMRCAVADICDPTAQSGCPRTASTGPASRCSSSIRPLPGAAA